MFRFFCSFDNVIFKVLLKATFVTRKLLTSVNKVFDLSKTFRNATPVRM